MLLTGAQPKGEIDHINGQRADNRAANLRDVDKAENQKNAARRSDNTSGVTGVYWDKTSKRWRATLRSTTVGGFERKEDAVAARLAAQRAHGFHENHGREKEGAAP